MVASSSGLLHLPQLLIFIDLNKFKKSIGAALTFTAKPTKFPDSTPCRYSETFLSESISEAKIVISSFSDS